MAQIVVIVIIIVLAYYFWKYFASRHTTEGDSQNDSHVVEEVFDSKHNAEQTGLDEFVTSTSENALSHSYIFTTIRSEKDLNSNLDGNLVEMYGFFSVTESGYQLQIRNNEVQNPNDYLSHNVKYKLPVPYSDVIVEIFPLPTSDSRRWGFEHAQYLRLYALNPCIIPRNPIPSLFGVLEYVNTNHYRLLGACRSLGNSAVTAAREIRNFVDTTLYLHPPIDDIVLRKRITNACRPNEDNYGICPENPLLLESIEDIIYLQDNIRDEKGCSFSWKRVPESILCVEKTGLGIITVYEYIIKNSMDSKQVSLFICRHGISMSPKDPGFYMPYGFALCNKEEFSEEELFDVCTEIVKETLVSKYSAHDGITEIEIYIPTSDGGIFAPCYVKEKVQEYLKKKMMENPGIKKSSPNEVGNAYKTQIIVSIYQAYTSKILWLIDPELRPKTDYVLHVHKDQTKGDNLDAKIAELEAENLYLRNCLIFRKNFDALLKANAFSNSTPK